MVLESLNPIENDKPLKKYFFLIFGGVRGPPKPPKNLKMGGFGGWNTPLNKKKYFFSKAYHFLWGLCFPEPFLYLICNKIKYFQIVLKIFGILLRILLNKTGPKIAKKHVSWLDS